MKKSNGGLPVQLGGELQKRAAGGHVDREKQLEKAALEVGHLPRTDMARSKGN